LCFLTHTLQITVTQNFCLIYCLICSRVRWLYGRICPICNWIHITFALEFVPFAQEFITYNDCNKPLAHHKGDHGEYHLRLWYWTLQGNWLYAIVIWINSLAREWPQWETQRLLRILQQKKDHLINTVTLQQDHEAAAILYFCTCCSCQFC